MSPCAPRISARAARTTPRPGCRKAAARSPASAATTWRNSWTARPPPSPRWAARACRGSARRRLPNRAACLPEHRRRHLYPFRHHGDPRRGRRRGQHDLQGPVQRRGGDDRRPAARRRADRAAGGASGRGGRGRADRRRHRRAREIYPSGTDWPPGLDGAPPRRPRCGATRFARIEGRHRADLRPDLRRREAPPPQARPLSRPAAARRHQRSGVRRLRRLRREIELRLGRAGRDRVRPQAGDRPVELQQGFFVPQGLLPELCHRRGRQPQAAQRQR